jgi:hypothetical protein
MEAANLIFIVVGVIVILFGIGAFIHPNLARWINAPGGARLKSLIALIIGILGVILGLFIKI